MKAICKRIFAACVHYKKVLFILLLYFIVTQALFNSSCPTVILFGWPCPACGLTRAGILLVTGRFSEAASYNPTIYLWAAFLIYYFCFRCIFNRKPPCCLLFAAFVGVGTMIFYVCTLAGGNAVSVGYEGLLNQQFMLAK